MATRTNPEGGKLLPKRGASKRVPKPVGGTRLKKSGRSNKVKK
jgi:hypothetical protein